jgi:hypothetical protein
MRREAHVRFLGGSLPRGRPLPGKGTGLSSTLRRLSRPRFYRRKFGAYWTDAIYGTHNPQRY